MAAADDPNGGEEEEEEAIDCAVEEREASMVPFFNPINQHPPQPINRKALFLKPIDPYSSPPTIVPSPSSGDLNPPYYHSDFRWWPDPQTHWAQWVDKLTPKYLPTWQKTGIHHAIISSTYKFSRQPSALLSLSLFWSHRTNTFIFPWGEATLTLQDVAVLGGFPIAGDPVRLRSQFSSGSDLALLDSTIRADFASFRRATTVTSNQCQWIKHHMESGSGDDLEHVAFLSLWLSRFVFAALNGKSIRERVFHFAVRLASGIRLALAPAVLASIYRDLRVIRNHARGTQQQNLTPLAVWAPINLLQLWIWERFPALSPQPSSSSIAPGKPRAARWAFAGRRVDTAAVMSALRSPEGFCWRPYGYGWFCSGGGGVSRDDEELQSFVRCLRGCELVGLDCIEQYLPHRVAMQFGFDQDVPGELVRTKSTWELAWITYDISSKNVKFCVPPWLHKPDVTVRYFNWWRSSSSSRSSSDDSQRPMNGRKRKEAQDVPPQEGNWKKVKGLSHETGGLLISCCDSKGLEETEVGDIKMKEFKEESEIDLSPANEEGRGGNDKENKDRLGEKEEKHKLEEELNHNPWPAAHEGVTMCLKNTNAEEFCHELTAEETIEQRNPLKKKELENELKIITRKSSSRNGRRRLNKRKRKEAQDALVPQERNQKKVKGSRNGRRRLNKRKRKEAQDALVPQGRNQNKVKGVLSCETGGLSISSCDSKGLKETNAEETATKESEMGDKKEQFKEESEIDLSPATEKGRGGNDKETNAEKTLADRLEEQEEKQKPDEEPSPDPLHANDNEKGVTICRMKTNAEEFRHELTRAAKETIEEMNPMKKKELERDLKIAKLKREISSIKKQINHLESLAGVLSETQIKQLEALAVALVQSRSKT